ncbi:hypothetical protein PFISCL1PPCAC_8377, partial [Pristionchus fissidentatus]
FLLSMADHVGTTLPGDKRGVSKMTAAIFHARSVLIEEVSSMLDLFWLWVRETEREQLLRVKNNEEMELGADAQSTTLREFEKLEERLRKEEVEKTQIASSTKIKAILDRFTLQMTKYIELYEEGGRRNDALSKLLLALKANRRPGEGQLAVKILNGPSARWMTNFL